MSDNRRQRAFQVRVQAATIARSRSHPRHQSNGDEERFAKPGSEERSHIGSYTKGLPHDEATGVIVSAADFDLFTRAIDTGAEEDIRAIPLGPQGGNPGRLFNSGIARGRDNSSTDEEGPADVRAWESMAAGNAFDLQGPDAQAVTMPPAPRLNSDELVAEMTENYWMALLRDTEFARFDSNQLVQRAMASLNDTKWVKTNPNSLNGAEAARHRGPFKSQTVFRGTTPGDDVGPYLSQFLLMGTPGLGNISSRADGFIEYGGMRMDQRVRVAVPEVDYMTTWASFIDAQNGADLRRRERYVGGAGAYRFISTPRDLATYVHYDALYQAYLNACVILLAEEVPFDKGIPFRGKDANDKQQGFAHFGGPHILTLVTEVATRALKAVRFQKFNTHRRLRPEAVAGLIERVHHEPDNELYAPARRLYQEMDSNLLDRIANENGRQNATLSDLGNRRSRDADPVDQDGRTRLLPMAFPEGSPMHPSYGAGHATVAGACVTVLKAFFKEDHELPNAFVSVNNGRSLRDIKGDLGAALTVGGELNKLCSNISVGRNWAGVHYFSDYLESVRMGEEIAIGMLEEQAITFQENFSMTLRKFNGRDIQIPDRN